MTAALAFDMYGTLVDPASLAGALAADVEDPQAVAAAWRRHQLEISWLLTAMGRYEDWAHVTRYGLLAALQEAESVLPAERLEELLGQAGVLVIYEDVRDALAGLCDAGHALAVFSNGTASELEVILAETGIGGYFADVISVDEVGVFKPAPDVYEYAARRLGRPIADVWLVSANPFDAAGGKAAGMRVCKLERKPSIRYAFAPPPDMTITSLAELPTALTERST
jgi:2-haloacid dehalogenase